MFGLFKKYCSICGKEIERNINIARFGKNFCSEEHAQQFVDEQGKIENLEQRMMEANKQSQNKSKGGCCCGGK